MSEEKEKPNFTKDKSIHSLQSPIFLTAKRVTGQVIIPKAAEEETNTRLISPPLLTRKASMKGNILRFNDNLNYFLQRKLIITSFGSVRVGFALNESREDNGLTYTAKPPLKNSHCPYPLDMVAIKLFDRERIEENTNTISPLPKAMKELAALSKMAEHYEHEGDDDSPRFVEYSSYIGQDKFSYYAVAPFYGEGTLFQYVVERGTLPEPVARHFFQQILKGLTTLREVGMCHRNINLTTIQLQGENCAITDLSSCIQLISDDNTSKQLLPPECAQGGNPRYIPPEVVRMEHFDGHDADLWAAGICLCQMIWGMEAPFVWASSEDARYQKMQDVGSNKSNMSGVCGIIHSMLRADPGERLSLDQILQHDWMQNKDTQAPSFLAEKKNAKPAA